MAERLGAGQAWELVKTADPALVGHTVEIERVEDDDWYTQTFDADDPRCFLVGKPGTFILASDLLRAYRLSDPADRMRHG